MSQQPKKEKLKIKSHLVQKQRRYWDMRLKAQIPGSEKGGRDVYYYVTAR
jgi:hypothetical protein